MDIAVHCIIKGLYSGKVWQIICDSSNQDHPHLYLQLIANHLADLFIHQTFLPNA